MSAVNCFISNFELNVFHVVLISPDLLDVYDLASLCPPMDVVRVEALDLIKVGLVLRQHFIHLVVLSPNSGGGEPLLGLVHVAARRAQKAARHLMNCATI